MSKYTPGPWYRSGCTVYALNDRKSCNRFSVLVQDAHTPREELEAVAKLMYAAPELLVALEACIGFADKDGFVNGINVRQAIAKARGEA